jgi:hypothetical protein
MAHFYLIYVLIPDADFSTQLVDFHRFCTEIMLTTFQENKLLKDRFDSQLMGTPYFAYHRLALFPLLDGRIELMKCPR